MSVNFTQSSRWKILKWTWIFCSSASLIWGEFLSLWNLFASRFALIIYIMNPGEGAEYPKRWSSNVFNSWPLNKKYNLRNIEVNHSSEELQSQQNSSNTLEIVKCCRNLFNRNLDQKETMLKEILCWVPL